MSGRFSSSPAGAEALLGEGATLGGKGEPYHCSDGTGGVLRSYHPLEQLRVSWHPAPDARRPSWRWTCAPTATPRRASSSARTTSTSGVDVDDLGRRWDAGLERVASLAESSA